MKAYRLRPAIVYFLSISIIFIACKDEALTPPSSPQNVTASPGEGEVTISWNAVQGAASYNIYWSESAGVTPTNGTLISNAVSPHTHTGLSFGTTYYYVVAAVNEAAPPIEVAAPVIEEEEIVPETFVIEAEVESKPVKVEEMLSACLFCEKPMKGRSVRQKNRNTRLHMSTAHPELEVTV